MKKIIFLLRPILLVSISLFFITIPVFAENIEIAKLAVPSFSGTHLRLGIGISVTGEGSPNPRTYYVLLPDTEKILLPGTTTEYVLLPGY